LHAKIDSVGVETQRNVVKEEMRQRYDNQPYGTILRETVKRSHQVHPYHWPVIGSLDHQNTATLKEFMQFYRTYSLPNTPVLTIAVAIDCAQTETKVSHYFSAVPVGIGTINRPPVTEPKRTQEIKDVEYDNIQLPAVVLRCNFPPRKHPDTYALNM